MANPEHVALVKKGANAIAAWRKSHPATQMDLAGADLTACRLTGANLAGAVLSDATLNSADLSRANLTGADLSDTDLSHAHLTGAYLRDTYLAGAVMRYADLRDANLAHANLAGAVLRDAHLSRANLSRANLAGAVLRDADLNGADLSDADLNGADLSDAVLMRAHLTRAHLSRANLAGAVLRDADLNGAVLEGANLAGAVLTSANLAGAVLTSANLTGADLTTADLMRTDLAGAVLEGAVLTGASIGWTILADVDLTDAVGLAEIHHAGPSSIAVDTLARTLRSSGGRFTNEQLIFFTGAGVSCTFLDYLPDLLETDPLQFYTCFISYSTKDDAFASALHDDLEKAGVKTWKWDLDGVVGRDLMENVDRAIRHYDKMILICSRHSLASKGVDKEIVKALQKEEQRWNTRRRLEKEAKDAGKEPPFVDVDVLVPIWIDGSVETWESPYASEVKKKMAADFRGVTHGSKEYQKKLQRLINALNPKSWPPKPPRSVR